VLYNKGLITNIAPDRIMVIPERTVHENSSVLTLQKVWRGYLTRKKYRKLLLEGICRTRAATRIQRWIRRLPWHHRKRFMALSEASLS